MRKYAFVHLGILEQAFRRHLWERRVEIASLEGVVEGFERAKSTVDKVLTTVDHRHLDDKHRVPGRWMVVDGGSGRIDTVVEKQMQKEAEIHGEREEK